MRQSGVVLVAVLAVMAMAAMIAGGLLFRMSADGNALKRPFLLGVERGHIKQIN